MFFRYLTKVKKLSAVLAYLLPAAYINSYCFSIYTVVGCSMQPSLNPIESGVRRDRVLIDKVTPWIFSRMTKEGTEVPSFRVGDVVLFTSPHDPSMTLIKRIVALEGDSVRATKLNPYRDEHTFGFRSSNSRFRGKTSVRDNCIEMQVSIPSGYAWVQSDEPYHGYDSTHFGPIPMGLIHGRALFIIWPIDRIGFITLKPHMNIVTQRVYSPVTYKNE